MNWDKLKNAAAKLFFVVILTAVYSKAAAYSRGMFKLIFFAVFAVFPPPPEIPFGVFAALSYVLIALIMAAIDIKLFKPLNRLFKRNGLVYLVQSGNVYSAYLIISLVSTNISKGFDVVFSFLFSGPPLAALLGGTALCFVYRKFQSRKKDKKAKNMKKILVGMSGGVDSSVAALLLKWQGYDISGCTLTLFDGENNNAADAKAVCDKLGIKHYVFDMKSLFREKVMDSFAECYINGGTPNPCINCNRHIKFGAMLDKALEMGFDGIATGHYADIKSDEKTGRYLLMRPADRKKDQTYVLYNMTQKQLAHTLFPLCDLSKEEIRRLAEENGLINARKPDSQDICFVPDGDYAGFIEKHTGRTFPKGNFVDTAGNILGEHSGLIRYTIGQRKGLGVTFGKPVYVCGKDPLSNTVILGGETDLFKTELEIEDVNLIALPEITEQITVTAKTRYSAKEQEAALFPPENGVMKIKFAEAVRAPAKGQACVFYIGDTVLGGGKIV